ncbi:MAG: RT0821/Lpp0805 family surface protein [Rhodospirillales bacterium]
MKKIVFVLSFALLAAGCTKEQMRTVTPMQVIGFAVGAAGGGLLGAQIGGGLGKTLFITAGTMAGGLGGYIVARQLERSDRAAHNKTATQALAEAPDGTTRHWSNPETGSSGIVMPVRSYRAGDGALCRDYRATVAVEDGFIRGTGIGCQEASGRWRLKMEELG